MKRARIFAGLYLSVAVATFGHSAGSAMPCHDITGAHPCNSAEDSIAGIFAGLFWPLYWSWEVQSHD